jgi:hypothetical protein
MRAGGPRDPAPSAVGGCARPPGLRALALAALGLATPAVGSRPALAQQAQNPSPMVEHTRAHPRLAERRPPGRRDELSLGTLFVPVRLASNPGAKKARPLLVTFHAGTWVPEVAGDAVASAAIAIQITASSGGYAAAFADPGRFPSLLAEAEEKAGARFRPVTLAGWSAGCGAVRELLRQPDSVSRIDRVLAIDGIHTDYVDGRPGPVEPRLETGKLEPWLAYSREAVAGRKRLLVAHTEIFPGTFASTTETADWLVGALGLRRQAVARWGPMGTVALSDTRAGRFRLLGFAGNSAPDHVDLLHALPDLLRMRE